MTGIDRVRLILVNDPGHAFHVDGDLDPHGGSRQLSGDRVMRARIRALIGAPGMAATAMTAAVMGAMAAAAIAVGACAPRPDRLPDTLLEQGRQYTTWLYANQYQKLWDRFSPEMRQSFGTVADLASFAGRAVARLGPERRALDERVDDVAPFRVYQRTAAFDTSRRPMLIEWSLAKDGEVTGFVVRPVPDETAGR